MGRFDRADSLRMRQAIHSLLLAMGLAGLIGVLATSAQRALHGEQIPVVAAVRNGGMRALTSGNAMDGFGGWSFDGKQIAFMRNGQIWVMGSNGARPHALTSGSGAWDALPTWRPDGKLIAFARLSPEGAGARLMLVDPETGEERALVQESDPVGQVAWDPSGRYIYYTAPQRIMRVDLAGKRKEVLAVSPDWEMLAGGLAISPDGKLAFFGAGPREGQGARYDLWYVALDGSQGEPTQLTRGGGIMPSLDRTGARLVYRNPRQATGIYLMELAQHTTRQIVADERGVMYFHPAFAPDGRSVLLSRLLLEGAPTKDGRARFTSHLYLHRLAQSGGD